MGTKITPSYANLFMSNLETLASQPIQPLLWKCYIHVDDIICIWPGTIPQLEKFLQDHSFHHSIKFTWEYSAESVIFLEISISTRVQDSPVHIH